MTRPQVRTAPAEPYDIARIRADFPALGQEVRGKPLVYLDNGSTSHKPQAVIDAVDDFYAHYNSNVHRGVHALSERATEAHIASRIKVAEFINASGADEIVFVRGTTEAINLVASSFGQRIRAGDEILVTEMEHHANIVPWQLLCERTGALLKVAPMDDTGTLRMDEFEGLLGPRTRLVAATHVSNALGTINPVKDIVDLAHAKGIPVLLDGAQATPHIALDVAAMDCDFYAFSGHKMYGPTGIGVLYGKREILESMPPYQGGGDMIRKVSFSGTEYAEIPHRFEAGTPDIAGAIGLGAALDYLSEIGLDRIAAYEHELLLYGTEQLGAIPGLRLIGTAANKAGILSFLIEGVPAADIGPLVDLRGVAIRAGHHCAMPALEHFGVGATARASLGMYNTREEIDVLVAALLRAQEMLA
ncbi:MAG: cysteine desulfurase [Chromatiales bacterium]|nr:cysteine desulfurase [Chromatiales bacterium]